MGWAKKSTFIVFIFVLLLMLEAVCIGIDLVVLNRVGIRIRISIVVHDDEAIPNVVDKILLVVLVKDNVIDQCLDIIQKIDMRTLYWCGCGHSGTLIVNTDGILDDENMLSV